MALIWHIIKKDWRLLRWMLLGWLVLSLVGALDHVFGRAMVKTDQGWRSLLPLWLDLIGVASFLQLILLVAHQVQADSLVGTAAFWMTRPIPRGTLLLAKLLGLGLFVLAPTLLTETVIMLAFHVPLGTILGAGLQLAWVMSMLLGALMLAAALTVTATRTLFLIVGVVVGLFVVLMSALSFLTPSTPAYAMAAFRGPTADITSPALLMTLRALAVFTTIWHLYTYRRPAIAIGVLAAGLAIASVGAKLWPADKLPLLGGVPTLANETWARDPATSRLRIESDERLVGTNVRSSRRGEVTEEETMAWLAAPIVLDGLPPVYRVKPYTVDAQVRFPDGHLVRSEEANPETREILLQPTPSPTPGPTDYVRQELWPTLLFVPEEAVARDGDLVGVYTGTFELQVDRHDILATMPLTIGAAYKDGPRSLLVTELREGVAGCVITLRMSDVSLLTDLLPWPQLSPRFRRRDGLDLRSQPSRPSGLGMFGAGPTVVGLVPFATNPFRPLDVSYQTVLPFYPVSSSVSSLAAAPDIPGPRCDQMDMVIERTTYAGNLRRTLELPDFRMNGGHHVSNKHDLHP